MDNNIEICLSEDEQLINLVKQNLHEFNRKNCEYIKKNSNEEHNNITKINFGIYNKEKLIGGLLGEIFFGWFHIKDFWINDKYRKYGLGTKAIKNVEQVAKKNNTMGIMVETWDFQAPEFYKKLGFVEWGRFDNWPPGVTCFYLYKKF